MPAVIGRQSAVWFTYQLRIDIWYLEAGGPTSDFLVYDACVDPHSMRYP